MAAHSAKIPAEKLNFESALEELEAIAERMRAETLTLEESLEAYARAKALSGRCRALLERADTLVRELDEKGELVPLSSRDAA